MAEELPVLIQVCLFLVILCPLSYGAESALYVPVLVREIGLETAKKTTTKITEQVKNTYPYIVFAQKSKMLKSKI